MLEQRNKRIVETLNRRQPDLTVIMDNVHKPHNLSAIARTCDSIGVGKLHAVVPKGSFRLGGKAASGTQKWVKAKYWRDTAEVTHTLKKKGFTIYAADLNPAAVDYRDIDYCKPTAILVGSELVGVSEQARACADYAMTVPLYGMAESLNVSVATAVVLYEAARQREAAGLYNSRRISQQTFARLRFEWLHPTVARYCQKHQLDYPVLSEDGDIVEAISGNARNGYAEFIRES
ncbi:MAG: tRNA (guanosine(18)-2'-O)-methyltransferase TrmH [Gammaproteobacteria bacterium]